MRLAIPTLIGTVLSGLGALVGCGGQSADGPPSIRLGDSVCDECNMIISDERWATATVVEGPRGPEPRMFDDFNCQVNYEVSHEDGAILARWSHSHPTRQWIPTEQAVFLMSPHLRTPMGSKTAAFGSRTEAEAAQAELTGEVMDFEIAWKRLGFTGTCVHESDAHPESPHPEPNDGP